MKIMIINPPHPAIGSRMAGEHLPPLGLLNIAGPLIDAGFSIDFLDADFSNMSYEKIIENVLKTKPDLVLMGHSGSTTAQPIINDISALIKDQLPKSEIIIGGVFPTYHFNEILRNNEAIDYIVIGEGETVCLNLVQALNRNENLESVNGIAFRKNGKIIKTKPAELINNLDNLRTAWELMKGYNYTYYGHKKAVVIQFSRGCPYPCNYCGQSLFWKKWRNRSPQSLADEMEMLHKVYGIEVFNFADENPSTNKRDWKKFLEALIAKNLDLILVGSIRADNIVRDKEFCICTKKQVLSAFYSVWKAMTKTP